MVQLNPSMSRQSQQTHHCLDQRRAEVSVTRLLDSCPRCTCWPCGKQSGRAARERLSAAAWGSHAAHPVRQSIHFQSAEPNRLAQALHATALSGRTCTGTACRSCLCQGNVQAERAEPGIQTPTPQVSSCGHIPGKQSAEPAND